MYITGTHLSDKDLRYDSRYGWKVFRIGTVRYNWPMSAHASQAFSIAHCTDSEDLPYGLTKQYKNKAI